VGVRSPPGWGAQDSYELVRQVARPRRAILATLGCSGLRARELCDLGRAGPRPREGSSTSATQRPARSVRSTSVHGCATTCPPTGPPSRARLMRADQPSRRGPALDGHGTTCSSAWCSPRSGAPTRSVLSRAWRRSRNYEPHLPTNLHLALFAAGADPLCHEPARPRRRQTTLNIYAQVLSRRDRTGVSTAFDQLVADALPSAAQEKIPDLTARVEADSERGRPRHTRGSAR
jgi:hypothetical protein